MAMRAISRATQCTLSLAKSSVNYAAWVVPGTIATAWFAWPALTPEFKKDTLGLQGGLIPRPNLGLSFGVAAQPAKPMRKFKFERTEIGVPATLVEDEEDEAEEEDDE